MLSCCTMLAGAFLFALAAAPLAASPQLDADASLLGAGLSAAEMQALPHGRGLGDVLDVAMLTPVSSSIAGGGIDLFDPLQLSLHGYSWTQLHHRWGEVDVDDPAAAGQPLLQLPLEAVGTVQVEDAWSAGPRLTLVTPVLATRGVRAVNQARVRGAFGRALDGAAWTPGGIFDREPAFAFGAPRQRRALRASREGLATSTVQVGNGTLFLLGEHLEHAHQYPQALGLQGAQRDSVVFALGQRWRGWPVQIRMAYQGVARDGFGAQWRWPEAQVQRQKAEAWLVQLEAARALRGRARLHVALGLGGRDERLTATSKGPQGQDLLAAWLQQARPSLPQRQRRFLATAKARLLWRPRFGTGHAPGSVRSRHGPAWQRRRLAASPQPLWSALAAAREVPLPLLALAPPSLPDNLPGTTLSLEISSKVGGYRRQLAADLGPYGLHDGGVPLQAAQLDAAAQGGAIAAQVRGQLSWRYVLRAAPRASRGLGPAALEAVGGYQVAYVAGSAHGVVQPAVIVGVAARAPLGRVAAFASLRREPEAPTAQLSDALGGDGIRGSRRVWADTNHDGLPQPDEMGAPLGRLGAGQVAPTPRLRVPSHLVGQLGMHAPLPRGWHAGVRGTVHVLRQRYVVAPPPAPGAARRAFTDPGGDGRGERPQADGKQRLWVLAEPSDSDAGARLGNAAAASAYYGVELELHSPANYPVFVGILGAAYLSGGEAPFGNYPDRNDPGALASPAAWPPPGANDAVHALGRYDHDRSFALKVQAGVRPIEGLSLLLAGRYRDGQPFARLVVDRTSASAPQLLMATGRGGARYTFRMSWDVRLRYATAALRPFGLTVVCDVYNLLNSATEIDEDPRTGATFRRALEAVPARSGWLGLELAFLP